MGPSFWGASGPFRDLFCESFDKPPNPTSVSADERLARVQKNIDPPGEGHFSVNAGVPNSKKRPHPAKRASRQPSRCRPRTNREGTRQSRLDRRRRTTARPGGRRGDGSAACEGVMPLARVPRASLLVSMSHMRTPIQTPRCPAFCPHPQKGSKNIIRGTREKNLRGLRRSNPESRSSKKKKGQRVLTL